MAILELGAEHLTNLHNISGRKSINHTCGGCVDAAPRILMDAVNLPNNKVMLFSGGEVSRVVGVVIR